MVPKEELNELFHYEDGIIYGKYVPWRRKESNSRVVGKPLGTFTSSGYLVVTFTDKRGGKHMELVHRVIYGLFNNSIPELLDHINRDPLDNHISNLRPADRSLNGQNRGPQSNTKWGLRGVYRNPKNGRFYVRIKLCGKSIYLGVTPCLGKAWRIRKDGETRYWPDV